MFGYYDTVGLNFRGTADELRALEATNRTHEVYNDLNQNKFQSLMQISYDGQKNHNSKEARDAYRKMANLDSKVQIFHVGDIMTKNVVVLSDDKTIFDAISVMQEGDFKQVPVFSRKNLISNMVTKSYLFNLILDDPEYIREILNRHLNILPSGGVITSDPVTDIRRIAQVMVEYRLNAIPIVNQNDNLVGIVSKTDILKAMANTPPLQIWA